MGFKRPVGIKIPSTITLCVCTLIWVLGSSLPSAVADEVDDVAEAPVTSILAGPEPVTRDRSASLEFYASPSDVTFFCSLDGSAPSACSSPVPFNQLADGPHVFEVHAEDAAGNVESPPARWEWTIDTIPPEGVVLGKSGFGQRFRLDTSLRLRWSGVDSGPGPLAYRLRYERIRPSGILAETAIVLDGTNETATDFTARPGFNYCFSVAAQDRAGNSTVSNARCVSIPLDDAKLLDRDGAWTRAVSGASYLESASRASIKGAVLVRHGVSASSIALVARKCPRCGVAEVVFAGRVVKRVNLVSDSILPGRIIEVARFRRPVSGNLKIKVESSERPVIVEGIGLGNIPRADEVLLHPNIGLKPAAERDLHEGLVDPRCLQALIEVAAQHRLTSVGPFVSGHSDFVKNTNRISLHTLGRAVDLYFVDGAPVAHGNRAARAAAKLLLELKPPVRPERLGSPWSWSYPDVVTFIKNHHDHIHYSCTSA